MKWMRYLNIFYWFERWAMEENDRDVAMANRARRAKENKSCEE
jgi:hypothetical protein